MTVWLAIAVTMLVATLFLSGCVAYILVSLSRTAPLLGTRLGLVELQVIRVSDAPQPARRPRHAELRLRPVVLQT
jgi:hypothetical protein